MFCYTPKYRPPQFSGLPKGWELLEAPQGGGLNRPDLRVSNYRFGVVGYTERLSPDDIEHHDLTFLGETETR